MALKHYTPSVDLPDAVKNAVELAGTRVAALEGEQSRLTAVVSELKTELVTLEHQITSANDEIEAKQKELSNILSLIESHSLNEKDAAIKLGESGQALRAVLIELDALNGEKAVLSGAVAALKESVAELKAEQDLIVSKNDAKKQQLEKIVSFLASEISSL